MTRTSALQSLAGNAAVAGVVQRDEKAPDIHQGRRRRGGRPSRAPGPAARPAGRAAKEQVDQWQEYVDWRADQLIANKEFNELEEMTRGFENPDIARQQSATSVGLRGSSATRKKPGVSGTTVDPKPVADDIMAPPAWDRDKELEFRTWASASSPSGRSTSRPLIPIRTSSTSGRWRGWPCSTTAW